MIKVESIRKTETVQVAEELGEERILMPHQERWYRLHKCTTRKKAIMDVVGHGITRKCV
jgi:hypothetical protein